jgi:acyl-CoA:acyl-CoA alkyltransferase
MQWKNVALEAIAVHVPEERVATRALESRLEPMYRALHISPGQVEALTGIRERRQWPENTRMADVASVAGRRALEQAGLESTRLGAVVYAGVCRDDLEPATACAVAEALGVSGEAFVFDVSNACLGALNAMVDIANRIELGHIEAGLVVSAESSRAIVDATIARLNGEPTYERYRLGLATMTGGSGAVAVVLTRAGFSDSTHRLVAGAALAAPQHHRLARWGPSHGLLGERINVMETDAAPVLEHGVALGQATWAAFLKTSGWRPSDVDKVICHQVGEGHRRAVLHALGIDLSRDFSTFTTFGNMGTVSLPATAALAAEAGFLRPGDRVGFLGIGSGLNCLMLGVQW